MSREREREVFGWVYSRPLLVRKNLGFMCPQPSPAWRSNGNFRVRGLLASSLGLVASWRTCLIADLWLLRTLMSTIYATFSNSRDVYSGTAKSVYWGTPLLLPQPLPVSVLSSAFNRPGPLYFPQQWQKERLSGHAFLASLAAGPLPECGWASHFSICLCFVVSGGGRTGRGNATVLGAHHASSGKRAGVLQHPLWPGPYEGSAC